MFPYSPTTSRIYPSGIPDGPGGRSGAHNWDQTYWFVRELCNGELFIKLRIWSCDSKYNVIFTRKTSYKPHLRPDACKYTLCSGPVSVLDFKMVITLFVDDPSTNQWHAIPSHSAAFIVLNVCLTCFLNMIIYNTFPPCDGTICIGLQDLMKCYIPLREVVEDTGTKLLSNLLTIWWCCVTEVIGLWRVLHDRPYYVFFCGKLH